MPRTLGRDLPDNFRDALVESDAAPFGIVSRRVKLFVIRGHVLGPVAREGAGEPVGIGEVVAAIMQVHPLAVPRQRNIATMGIHPRSCQHMGAVHRHALRLVDRRGIATVDTAIVLQIEADTAPVIGAHGHALCADLFDGTERAVFYADPEARKPAFRLVIDFGEMIGRKKTSAQITENCSPDALLGRRVVAVVNFSPRQIGKFMSEVLTLGFADATGAVVLFKPDQPVPDGSRLF
jgi:tRNA-binding protein